MPIYKQTTEITKIDDVWANIDKDIVEVYFGDKNIFTVWREYDGSLPITINANGDALIDYRIYGASGGVGVATESEEPAGYKLPMVTSDGTTDIDTPVYIGENQLMEDEYVSYGEQKMYKRTENLWNPNTAEKKRIVFNGTIENYPDYALNTIPIESGTKYYFYASEVYSSVHTFWQYRNNNDEIVGEARNARGVQRAAFTAPEGVTKVIICFNNAWDNDKIRDFGFYQRSTEPAEYIPYVAPTDPPVPLPEIPTIDGTTVIDYDGTPKPSQMYVKYRKQYS